MLREPRIRRRGASGGGGGSGVTVDDEWHYIGDTGEPAFENGFMGIVSPYTPGFRKVGDYIEIAGLYLGAANTTIFTLPVGYRPSDTCVAFGVVVDVSVGGTINMFDGFIIGADGTVKSGSNPAGYGTPLWSAVNGCLIPLAPPESP